MNSMQAKTNRLKIIRKAAAVFLVILFAAAVYCSPAYAGDVYVYQSGTPFGCESSTLNLRDCTTDESSCWGIDSARQSECFSTWWNCSSERSLVIKANDLVEGGRYKVSSLGISDLDGYHHDGGGFNNCNGGVCTSNTININGSHGFTIYYQERARYQVSRNFDVGKTAETDPQSDWMNVGSTVNLSASGVAGYICTGWSNGTGTFPTSGSSCSTGNRTLAGDRSTANAITWEYKKAQLLSIGVTGPTYDLSVSSVSTAGGNTATDYTGGTSLLTRRGTVTISANRVIASGNDRWRLMSYTVGSTTTNVTGDTGTETISFDLQADTAVTLTYRAERKITVSFEASAPLKVQQAAYPTLEGSSIGILNGQGDFWVQVNDSITARVTASVTDPDTNIVYACTKYDGTGSFPASGTGSSVTRTIAVLSTLRWTCGRTHSVNMTAQGLPETVKSQSLSLGFAAGANSVSQALAFGTTSFALNTSLTLTAPNIIYDQGNAVRYVLTGYVGSGNVPAAGTADNSAGSITTATNVFDINQNSSITWLYRKDLRVKVTTAGHTGPLTVNEQTGTVVKGSAAVSVSSTSGLSAGMSVNGNGILPGTTLLAVNDQTHITLSTSAWLSLTADLSFYALAATLPDPRECSASTDPYTCVNWANAKPAAEGAKQSVINYYPVNTRVNATALYAFEDTAAGKMRACTRVEVTGSLPTDWFEQLLSGRKVATFTLSDPVALQWSYDNSVKWTVGQSITYPGDPVADGVDTTKMPIARIIANSDADDTAENSFYWSAYDRNFYPVRQVSSVGIKWWNTSGAYTSEWIGYTAFPAVKQRHIAKVPVNLQPEGSAYSFVKILYPVAGPSAANNVFVSDAARTTVLLFAEGATANTGQSPARILVVDTVDYSGLVVDNNNALDSQKCEVGSEINGVNAFGHRDPENRNGYVLNEKAVYDGYGSDRAYDRDSRMGNIIPVNKTTSSGVTGIADPLIVVWFETTSAGLNLGWPVRPVRYTCSWPANPESLVIASGQGKSVLNYAGALVYNQPDKSKPGFNPNEEHAIIINGKLYALRNDLNAVFGNLSEPYVLLKFKDEAGWHMLPIRVYDTYGTATFYYDLDAGSPILPPSPLGLLPLLQNNRIKPGTTTDWYHRDHKGGHWAKAANWKTGEVIDNQDKSRVTMHWYYPMQPSFYLPGAAEGDAVPFLNNARIAADAPRDLVYYVKWPADAPELPIGDTLMKSKYNLPDLSQQAVARVMFDEGMYRGDGPLVKLFDPLGDRSVSLAAVPAAIQTENRNGLVYFTELPYYLRTRLLYNASTKKLVFKGYLDASGLGEPLLLLNVMSTGERDALLALSTASSWATAVSNLYGLSTNPDSLSFTGPSVGNPYRAGVVYTAAEWAAKWGLNLGLAKDAATGSPVPLKLVGTPMALTAGLARGTGYVTLAFNDDASLGAAPVSLAVIRISDTVATGEIKVINSDNVFDEKLTLRHSLDFSGDPSKMVFEWYYQGDSTGVAPNLPSGPDKSGWTLFRRGEGLQTITIEGTGPMILADNWFMVRYYFGGIPAPEKPAEAGVPVFPAPISAAPFCSPAVTPCNATSNPQDIRNWSGWAGAPGGGRAQLAEGWLKRVFGALNLFDARIRDFRSSENNTLVSMLSQIGQGYEGDIALNSSASNLNSIGLLESYLTLLNRAEKFSIDAGYNDGPANNALLNAASRIADFYMLLGNEAYADAQDPTIGFTTKSSQFGTGAPTIFAFQNQLDSLLEEELVLLRGRDDTTTTVKAKPVYNRLIWNFTQGDGEVAYVKAYNITDQDKNGIIDENDAKIMFPQGHGDAWGYYLSAIKTYYTLLNKQNFSWIPRAESVLVGNAPITVDYMDERKFARIAAQKAKTGTEVLDLTYRRNYVDDPAGQWQGYKDTDGQRAWGVDEWSRRAGQGAYFDWAMANALLPDKDQNPAHTGITRIDRTTVQELKTIASEHYNIQSRADKANNGLNPLGLAKGVVPFDIDPALITPNAANGGQSLTHFEQVYARAQAALKNAVTVFDYANDYTKMLRANQDTLEKFKQNIHEQEVDFKNRLIEIFGYPYPEDIGTAPDQAWASGYDGPDWIHFMYVDVPELTGEAASKEIKKYSFNFNFTEKDFDRDAGITAENKSRTIVFEVPGDEGWMSKPSGWTKRRAPGRIQDALSEVIKAHASFNTGLREFETSVRKIEVAEDELRSVYDVSLDSIEVRETATEKTVGMKAAKAVLDVAAKGFGRLKENLEHAAELSMIGFPTLVGPLVVDAAAPMRFSVKMAQKIGDTALTGLTIGAEIGSQALQAGIDFVDRETQKKLALNDARLAVQQKVGALEITFNESLAKKANLITLQAVIDQKLGAYRAVLAEGERLIEQRAEFRRYTAGDVQSYRYEDMAFRVFRNDALQKYRAQFDLAARYVYLAAAAYDYETNLLGSESGAGRQFFTDIIKQRSLGELVNGLPLAGRPGLADPMARLSQNFAVYKTQLGFNNPQTETNRFSLRTELFRIKYPSTASDALWAAELRKYRVSDLWQVPEFKRYCRPFAEESAGAQPGIVIPLSTNIVFGNNFFGWPLGGGDSAYDPSHFATRIRSVGVWFTNYNASGLSYTPRVYLVPVGDDILRSPSGDGFAKRAWHVVDQKLPVPYPLGAATLSSETWIPANDSLSEEMGGIRQVSSFRAYHDSGAFNAAETASDSRLIGRSVWNTKWLLIIPGGTLLNNANDGLNTFINSVRDIKLFFQTYSYSGN